MTEPTKLEPCPFCGAEPEDYTEAETASCRTPECPLSGQLFFYERWNRRAQPAPEKPSERLGADSYKPFVPEKPLAERNAEVFAAHDPAKHQLEHRRLVSEDWIPSASNDPSRYTDGDRQTREFRNRPLTPAEHSARQTAKARAEWEANREKSVLCVADCRSQKSDEVQLSFESWIDDGEPGWLRDVRYTIRTELTTEECRSAWEAMEATETPRARVWKGRRWVVERTSNHGVSLGVYDSGSPNWDMPGFVFSLRPETPAEIVEDYRALSDDERKKWRLEAELDGLWTPVAEYSYADVAKGEWPLRITPVPAPSVVPWTKPKQAIGKVVRRKGSDDHATLITFAEIQHGEWYFNLSGFLSKTGPDLLANFEQLNGQPCGEEVRS